MTKQINIVGTYKSYYKLYGFPSLEVNFNSDSTFVYKMPYVNEFEGTWVVKRDTLILYSDWFPTQPPCESAPAYKYNKYTDLEGKDAFLIKGKKLFVLSKTGVDKKDYLFKVIK